MMLDSDSDDDIIPSVQKLGGLFSKVHQAARNVQSSSSASKNISQPTSTDIKPPNCSSSSKSKSKSLNPKAKSDNIKPDVIKKSKKVSLSEDTEGLLAEIDGLTANIPAPSSTSRKRPSSVSPIIDLTYVPPAKPKRGGRRRGGRRSRRKSRRMEPEPLNISDILNDSQLKPVDVDDNEIEELAVVNQPDTCHLLVRWKEDTMRFQLPMGSRVSKLRMEIASKVSARADDLVIMNKYSEEVKDDILVQNLEFGQVLDAFLRSQKRQGQPSAKGPTIDPDCVQLKVQGSGGHRDKITIIIKRTTYLKQMIEDYKEKFNLQGKEFKLVFDGEVMDLNETPESLDLDGGEIFDIVEIS